MPTNNEAPIVNKYASRSASPLWERLVAMRQQLPQETLDALRERASKGYKPVNVEEKYIDVDNENDFNAYKKLLNSIPNDPNRNNIIAELGYKPVLRYNKRIVTPGTSQVVNNVPKTLYQLGFTTMPNKTLTLNSEDEYKQAQSIADIDGYLANVYKNKFNPNLNKDDAYNSYTNANPKDYSKMYLNEQERNAAIMEYAKQKGMNPQEVVNMYTQNRDKYYPRDLVAGQGNLEQTGQGAASTNYGYRNYLTTMVPKQIQTSTQETKTVPVENIEEQQMTYPFKFGYKNTGSNYVPPTQKKSGPDYPDESCPGGVCEKMGEIMSNKNKFLFKKKYGGALKKENIQNAFALLKINK